MNGGDRGSLLRKSVEKALADPKPATAKKLGDIDGLLLRGVIITAEKVSDSNYKNHLGNLPKARSNIKRIVSKTKTHCLIHNFIKLLITIFMTLVTSLVRLLQILFLLGSRETILNPIILNIL